MLQTNRVRARGKMRKPGTPIEYGLLLPVLMLITVGCIFIYDFTVVSTTVPSKYYYLMRQLVFAVAGIVSVLIISRIDYHKLDQFAFPLLIVVVTLYTCVYFAGPSGFIQRHAPDFSIKVLDINVEQFTEPVALLILAHFVACIDSSRTNKLLTGCLAVFACLLPLISSSPKTVLVLLLTLYTLLFLISGWVLFIATIILAVICWFVLRQPGLFEYIISVWMDPLSDIAGAGPAAVQPIYAIADGGIFGIGLGRGMMCYAVDDVHSTFMLSAITQEVGLIGAFVLLLVYLLLFTRMFYIACRAADKWGFFLSAAIMARYCILFVIYLLVQVNVIPPYDSVSLPFLSYGGTPLITDCVLIGIMLSIGRNQPKPMRR